MKYASLDKFLAKPAPFIAADDKYDNVALFSSIHLSRNLQDFVFPEALPVYLQEKVCDMVLTAVWESGVFGGKRVMIFDNNSLHGIDGKVIAEHLNIPESFIENSSRRMLFTSPDLNNSLLVNGEDHLLFRGIVPGLNLHSIWKKLDIADDKLSCHLKYAFDNKTGYPTANPGCCGTGMRASVALHLPGLFLSGKITKAVAGLRMLNISHADMLTGSQDAPNHFLIISNTMTSGISENKIIDELTEVAKELIHHEKISRKNLWTNSRDTVMDFVGKSYGIMRYSYKLTPPDFIRAYSGLRLGADLKLFSSLNMVSVNKMLPDCFNWHLLAFPQTESHSQDPDILRAAMCRKLLS